MLEQICQLLTSICRDTFEVALFRAASLLTFFGALRISEVVAAGKGNASTLALQWHDVMLEEDSVRIHICQSKADQRGKGENLMLGPCSIEILCPVKAIGAYLKVRGHGHDYFFIH